MNRYKEKYSGASSSQSAAGNKRPHDPARENGPAGAAQAGTGTSRKPGIIDRIKRLFGIGGKPE
jgi:hypothetical protein